MNAPGGNAPAVVVLCGFMGTGKTTVGEALARRYGVEFIDTDAVIEARAGRTIAEIFERDGEAHFRELESTVCHELRPEGGAVIATGGGMVTSPRNLVHLRSLGTTVLLEADVDTILRRVGSASDRPMIAPAAADGGARGRIESLLESRRSAYEQCDLRLDTSSRTCEEAAQDIHDMLDARSAGHVLVPLRVDTRPVPGCAPTVANARISRVVVGTGVASELGAWLDRLGLRTSVVVLAPSHLRAAVDTVVGSLGATPAHVIDVDDGDGNKTLDQAARLLDAMVDAGAGRDTVVVTVGGGVTGDVGGFVAATYMRGLPLVQVPTSLVAQVDASIGGKTGVNHPRAKNIIGAVYQPLLVLADPDLLATLPAREMAGGMAEVIKTAIIGSAGLFERLSLDTGPALLADVVAECARIKGGIVESDPYERDRRRVLNLGHTLGHALESSLEYALTHGEAVGLGLLAAWRVAIGRGLAEPRWLDETRELLEHFGLPADIPDVDVARVRDALGLDKKRRAGRLTFVLPRHPGRVDIVDDVTENELVAAMRD